MLCWVVWVPGEKTVFLFWKYLFGCAPSLLQHVGSSSLTMAQAWAPCMGSMKSSPLDHRGCPPNHQSYLYVCPHLFPRVMNEAGGLWSSQLPTTEHESRSVVPDSLWPHGLYNPWNSPGQNTEVGSLLLLQGIFPTQGLNPGLPNCRRITNWAIREAPPMTGTGLKNVLVLGRHHWVAGGTSWVLDSVPGRSKEPLSSWYYDLAYFSNKLWLKITKDDLGGSVPFTDVVGMEVRFNLL